MQKSRKVINTILGSPHIRIGKKGINENVIESVKELLKKEGVIKIKIMKSFKRAYGLEINEIASKIAELVNGEVRDVRGNTFVITKKNVKGRSAAGGI